MRTGPRFNHACSEVDSKIHRQFRSAHEGHRAHAGLDPSRASTGVIWCTERAIEHGFHDNPSAWAYDTYFSPHLVNMLLTLIFEEISDKVLLKLTMILKAALNDRRPLIFP